MNKWLELLIGLILIAVPLLLVTLVPLFNSWGTAALEFLKGGIVILIILIGIVFIIFWISDLRD